jgi:Tol biopolymer transport system component
VVRPIQEEDCAGPLTGSKIAVYLDRVQTNGMVADLYVLNLPSRHLTLISRNAQDTSGRDPEAPSWSPDGSLLAFTQWWPADSFPQIWVARAGEGHSTPKLLAQVAAQPAWSPDGARIAFTRYSGNDWREDVHIMWADGTHDRRLSAGSSPSWSPEVLVARWDLHRLHGA